MRPQTKIDKKIENKTPIDTVLEANHSLISNLATNILNDLSSHQNITEISGPLLQYLSSVTCLDQSIELLIEKISFILSKNFTDGCFDPIFQKIPQICIDPTKSITENGQGLFTQFFTKITKAIGEKGQLPIQYLATIFHVFDTIVLSIITRTTELVFEIPNTNCKFIFQKYLNKLFLESNEDPNIAMLRQLNIKKWEKLIYMLSLLEPKETFEFFKNSMDIVPKEPTLLFVYKMFESFSFQKLSKTEILELNNHQIFFKTLISKLKYNPSVTNVQIAASNLMTNIVGNCLVLEDTERPHAFLDDMRRTISSINCVTVFPLHAIFTVMSHEREQFSYISLAEEYFRETNVTPALILSAFTIILRGWNFDVPCSKASRFLWRAKDDDSIYISDMMICVIEYEHFDNCQDELCDFLLQVAYNNFHDFVPKYFSEMCKSESFSSYNANAIFNLARIILSNPEISSRFPVEFISFKSAVESFVAVTIGPKPPTRTNVIIAVSNSPCPYDKIYETSYPIMPSTVQNLLIMSEILKWMKSFGALESKKTKLAPEDMEEISLKCCTEMNKVNDPIVRALSLLTYVDFKENVIISMIPYIYDKRAHVASVATRALLALIIQEPSRLSFIISELVKCTANNSPQLFMQINAACMYISSASSYLNNEVIETIAPLVVTGICSQYIQVRSRAFDLLYLIPPLKKYFHNNQEMFKQFLIKLAGIYSSTTDISVFFSAAIPIADMARTQFYFHYHIYLSVAFSEINDPEVAKIFDSCRQLMIRAFKTLHNKQISPTDRPSSFLLNIATFLVATATSVQPSPDEFKELISILVHIKRNELLYSFVGSVNISRADPVLLLLSGPNEEYIRAFAFACKIFWYKCQKANKEQLMTVMFNHLDNPMKICHATMIVSMDVIQEVNLNNKKLIIDSLKDISIVIKHICDYYRSLNIKQPAGPFLRQQYVEKCIDKSKWFIFMYNVSQCGNQEIEEIAKESFASLCRVITVEDADFRLIQINQLIKTNLQVCIAIFNNSNSYSFLFDTYLKDAAIYPEFLDCFASQFLKFSSISKGLANIIDQSYHQMTKNDMEFAKITYSNFGNLIAVSLLYLTNEIPDHEESAQRIIWNISLTGSILNHNNDDFKCLLLFLNSHSLFHMSKDEMQELSTLLANAFRFCAEQFLNQAFEIIKTKTYHIFISLLSPWIHLINMELSIYRPSDNDIPEDETQEVIGIIQGTESMFSSFSPLKFMSEFIQYLCNPPLNPGIIGLLDILVMNENHRLLVYLLIMDLFNKFPVQCSTVLQLLCNDYPDVCNNFASYFNCRFWFYHMLQLNNYDKTFDIDIFLHDLDSGEEKPEYEKQTKEYDVDDYDKTIDFALEVIIPNPNLLKKLKPYVLAYLLSNSTKNNKKAKKILKQVIGSESPTKEMLLNFLSKKQINTFVNTCFSWGIECGNILIAEKGVIYADLLLDRRTNSKYMIPVIIRTLKILVNINSEISNNHCTKKVSSMLANCDAIEKENTYSYIASLIRLLSNANLNTQDPDPSVFFIILQFLPNADHTSFDKIFHNTVSALYNHVMNHVNLNNKPHNFRCILDLLQEIENHVIEQKIALNCFNQLYETVGNLLAQGHEDVFVNCENPVHATVLFLVPFLGSRNCSQNLFDSISEKVKPLIDISLIANNFSQSNMTEASTSFYSSLVSKVNTKTIQKIFQVFTYYLKYEKPPQNIYSSNIYATCSGIISLQDCPIPNESIGRIVFNMLKDKNATSIDIIRHYSFNRLPEQTSSSSATFKLSVTDIDFDFDPANWNLVDDDDFPPLCPLSFPSITNYFEKLKESCLTVKLQPFTKWAHITFLAEALNVKGAETENSFNVVREDVDHLYNLISSSNNQALARHKTPDLISKEASSAALTTTLFDMALTIDPESFVPDISEIDEIGLDDDDFPSVFSHL